MTILTPEQEALIPVYQEKWKAIALSTEPINRQRAEAAIKAVYAIMGKNAPQIRFCSSPYEANFSALESDHNSLSLTDGIREICHFIRSTYKFFNHPLFKLRSELNDSAINMIRRIFKCRFPEDMELAEIAGYISQMLKDSEKSSAFQDSNSSRTEIPRFMRVIYSPFEQMIKPGVQDSVKEMLAIMRSQEVESVNWIERSLYEVSRQQQLQVWEKINIIECMSFQPIPSAVTSIWLDFCTSVLHFPIKKKKWEVFASLVKECGWIFCDDEICVVCDRPRILSLDSENRLHAEGKPAIQFADGFSVYAYHGVRLPEAYGKLHPRQWRSEWLLSEDNAELKRVLIQGIGYARICQELQAVELDSFAEYTLLIIDSDADIEAIYLLKMNDPSTGYIHVLRVPPDVQSAREAIKWVNWGIDPEEFSIQS